MKSNSSDCGIVPELCPSFLFDTDDPGPTHEPEPADPSEIASSPSESSKVIFKDVNHEYLVYPIPLKDDSNSFAVHTDEMQIVISDTENELFTRFADETIEVPACIYKIFEMNYQKWSDGVLSTDDLSSTFEGSQSYIDESGDYLVVEDDYSVHVDLDCPPPSKRVNVYVFCDYRNSATTNAIVNHLMSGVSESVINATKFTIRKAVAECAPSAPDCFGCIPQTCILDKLRDLLSPQLAIKMRINYLVKLLNLNDEQKVFLEQNPIYLDDLLDKYDLISLTGCESVDKCGSEAADQAHLCLLNAGVVVNEAEQLKLCSIFRDLYIDNEDDGRYDCIMDLNDANLYYTLINFDFF